MNIKLPAKDDVEVDMAPMIDMVFLLLIFFMVASVVPELDKQKIDIPKSKYAKVPEDLKGREIITVDVNEKIYTGITEISLDMLKARLNDKINENPDLRVLIRADENVTYKRNKEVMRVCAEVGAIDLIYTTFEE